MASYPNETAVCGNTAGGLKREHANEHEGIIGPKELLSQAKPGSQRDGGEAEDGQDY